MSFFSKKPAEPATSIFEPAVEEPEVETAEADIPAPQEVKEAEPAKKYRSNTTIIGAGTIFEGNITTADNIEINGTMRGDIQSSADMIISGTGVYFGDANMANLNVDGRAEGNIECDGHTVLTNTGIVKGSIISASLTPAPGATIEGTMSLNSKPKAAKKEEPAPAEELAEEPEEAPEVIEESISEAEAKLDELFK